MNKKNIFLIAGILISLICSWLFARKIEWSPLCEALKDANYIYVIPTIIITLLCLYIRAIRWSELLKPIKKVSTLSTFSITVIGFMSNNVLPARVGELIRPVLLGKKENIKFATSLATVVMERTFDMLSLIIIASITLFVIPLESTRETNNINHAEVNMSNHEDATVNDDITASPQTISKAKETNLFTIQRLRKWSAILASVAVLGIIFLVLLSLYPKKVSDAVEKLIFFIPFNTKNKIINLLHSFMSGLQIFEDKRKLLWIGLLSLFIWILNASAIYMLSYSFDIDLPILGAFFVTVCLSIAVALPQAPGYIGVFHIAIIKSLDIFGVELSSAQSYAIIMWAISIIPVTILGLLFLWREGMHLRDLAKQDEKLLG